MSKPYQHQLPFNCGRLAVSEVHELYFEEYGNPDGNPALFVVGGPGGSTSINDTIYFDPAVYRVVIFDQRGAGRSSPSAEIRDNTSQHMVADIEALRSRLRIEKWHLVFGGSWGSALSLMYAQAHSARVGSLILRGVFTGRAQELEFHRGPKGAAMLFPEAYTAFLQLLAPEDHKDPVRGYLKLLGSLDGSERRAAARAFNAWDLWTNRVDPSKEAWERLDDDKWCMEHAMLECHYFTNGLFVEEGEILREENIRKIRHIPTTIIQGQFDICTAPKTAWELHKLLPESALVIVPLAGHSAKEPEILEQLIKACDKHATLSN